MVFNAIRENPIAGPFFSTLNRNIISPLGDIVLTITDIAISTLKNDVVPQARKHYYIAGGVGVVLVYFFIRAYRKKNNPGDIPS